MTDGSGTETSTYDTLDRLTAVTRGANTFSYAYDLANPTQVTYPGSTSVAYGFDDDERLQSVVSGGQTTSYAYDEAANLRTTTLPSGNGYVETRTYDRAGRLVDIESKKGATTLSRFTIAPDLVGNPLSVVRSGSLAQTQTYSYDNMDRLTSVCFQAGTCPGASDPFIRWSYDGVGNRLTEARPVGTTSYTYNAADELTQAGSAAYTYDQNGNELSAGARTFSYDLANRMNTTTQGSTTTTYLYDGDGKRLQASTGSQANKKTNFLWDVSRALPQIALERDGNSNPIRTHRYGARRISQTAGNNTSYFLYDGRGSVANLTSSSGATQWTWSYEPYGAIRTETKASGNQPDNLMKFTGEYLDPTGLYHLRARQYDPGTGRFLTRDPLASSRAAAHVASYAYVSNRPTVWIDPAGLRWCDPLCGVPSAIDSGVETGVTRVSELIEETNLDVALAGAAVVCFVVAPEAAPGCAVIAAAAYLASTTRSAVESGVVGNRPTNYCRFGLSVAASTALYGTGTAISQLWKEPYVLSKLDRRILRSSTEFLSGDLDILSGAGAAALCAPDSEGRLGSSGK